MEPFGLFSYWSRFPKTGLLCFVLELLINRANLHFLVCIFPVIVVLCNIHGVRGFCVFIHKPCMIFTPFFYTFLSVLRSFDSVPEILKVVRVLVWRFDVLRSIYLFLKGTVEYLERLNPSPIAFSWFPMLNWSVRCLNKSIKHSHSNLGAISRNH